MKKIFLFVLIVCMCFVLGACTATDSDNLFGSVPEDTSSEDIMYYTGAYQYGNMQQSSIHRFMLIDNEVVFDHYRYNEYDSLVFTRVFSYDLITAEVRSYCKDATCTHEKCATSPLVTKLEVYNGKVYGKDNGMQVVEANEKGANIIVNSEVNDFFHHGDKLYVKTMDSSLVAFEEGKTEPQIILEEYTGNDPAIFGNYLYAKRNDTDYIRVDLTADEPQEEIIIENVYGKTDGQYIYYVDWETYQLYRCDMEGKNAELLVDQPVYPTSINFDDEYFYYRLYTDMQKTEHPDSRDIYRFSKDDPSNSEKIATLPRSIKLLYTVPGTGKLFIHVFHKSGDKDVTYYVLGTDGSNPTKLELPEY